MPRPLSPALLTTFALALVDDAAVIDAGVHSLSAALVRRDHMPEEDASTTEVTAAAAVAPTVDPALDPKDSGWSAAFVQHVGYWSHFDYRFGTSVWPLPDTTSCTELAAFAARHFVLAADEPEPGDIYLLWSPAKKLFVRTGIVLSRSRRFRYPTGGKRYECLTIDGDTTCDGALHGPHTALVQRTLSPSSGDRLIRWPLLELVPGEERWADALPLRRAA